MMQNSADSSKEYVGENTPSISIDKPDMTARAIENEFEQAVLYDYSNRQRNQANWKMYAGIDFGQYSPSELAQAQAEGRHVDTYNIVTQKVDSLAGAIIKNPFDFDFVAVEQGEAELTQAIKQAALSDKELMDWETSYNELVIAGLVYEGVEEMFIDKCIHPLGNIAFRMNLPGHIVFDPNWKTNSAKDCEKCWKVSYLTAAAIKKLWPNLQGRLEADLLQIKVQGNDFDATSKGVTPNFDVLQDVGGVGTKYRVIQQYEMVDEEIEEEYDEMTGAVLPETEDVAFKIAWLNERNPSWEPNKLKIRKSKKKIQYCSVIIPEVAQNTIVERKRTRIQVGRLQFFPWSAARINGVNRGIVDLIRDIQRNINHREMLISFIIQTEAQGGEIMDPLLFNNDQALIDEYVSTKNQPNKTFTSAPGALSRNLMPQKIRKSEFPNDIQQQLMRMWDYADRISKSPAAYDARTDSSSESGYLYAQKVRQAEQQQYILFAGLKRHLNEKGEAYLEQAKIQYSFKGYEREFLIPGEDNKPAKLNEKIKLENGQVGIKADVSRLARHKVVVAESPGGLTNRLITRAVAAEVMNSIPPDNIGTRTVLASSIVGSIDTFSATDKDKLQGFRRLEEEQAKQTLLFSIENLKFQQLNVKNQIKALEASMVPKPTVSGAVPGTPQIGAPGQPQPAPAAPQGPPPEQQTAATPQGELLQQFRAEQAGQPPI